MTESEDLVVVHHATSQGEAELIRGILLGAGIQALIPEESIPLPGLDLTPFNGEYNPTGCEVVVLRSNVEKAKQVLQEAREAGAESAEDDAGGDDDAVDGEVEDGGEAGD